MTQDTPLDGLSLRDAAVKLNDTRLRNWKIQQIAQAIQDAEKSKKRFKDVEGFITAIENSPIEDWGIIDLFLNNRNDYAVVNTCCLQGSGATTIGYLN